MNKKELQNPSILTGAMDNKKDHPNNALAKQVEFGKKDTIKTKHGIIPLDRSGISDKALAKIMNSKVSQEQKDIALANYLFQRQLDTVGYVAEIAQYQGRHTKETRAFKSQMRFDFEIFVNLFTNFLSDTGETVFETVFPSGDINQVIEEIKESDDAKKLLSNKFKITDSKQVALILLAVEMKNHADILTNAVKKVTQQREREKGRGIYIDKLGKPHDLLEENLYDIIQAEKDELKKQKEK